MNNSDLLKKYQIEQKLLSQVTDFQVDSRNVGKGTVFFALKGDRCSGEDFLKKVSDNQGIIAFTSKKYKKEGFGLKLIKVDDPFTVLQDLAKDKLSGFKGTIVGITGSVGKTTTKDFLAKLLEDNFKVSKTPRSQNSQIGLPLTVLNSDLSADIQILEMGMSEMPNISKLTRIATPDIALITKIGYAHLENFDSLAKIAEAKSTIFTRDTKIKIVDYELIQYSCIFSHDPITFSITDKKADYFLDMKTGGLYERGEKAIAFSLPFREPSFLHNLLGSITIARELGVSYKNIQLKMFELKLPPMRFEKLKKNNILYINDSYNSNPTSLSAAIENLSFYKKRKIAVLGSMLELGKHSETKHFEIGKLAAAKIDILLTIGKECETMHQAFVAEKSSAYHFSDLSTLVSKLKEILREDDVVLVKGSRAAHLEKLFELI